jgi:diguanylate cyclase (GGDEF)-like protein
MEAVRRLRGAAVADERPLAGRLIGWMFVVGSILTSLLPLVPGAEGEVVTPTLPLAVIVFAWGLHAALRRDWTRTPGWVMHAALVAGVACIAVAVYDTGGVDSPSRFLILLVLAFAGYFFTAREAWPYLGLALAMRATPLLYEPEALGTALVAELLILFPCYTLLMFLLTSGKRGMVSLRAEADALARRDPLTGIANRRALVEGIQGLDGDVGLLVLDVDDFKSVNTRYGHPGGDRALVFVAEALRTASRETDLPARLGGDEFAVLVAGARPAGMEALAQRLLAEIRLGDTVRVSAGWVIGGANAEQLLLEADEALRAAKRTGKNRVLAYS